MISAGHCVPSFTRAAARRSIRPTWDRSVARAGRCRVQREPEHSFVAAARLQWCAVKSLSRAPLKLENVMKLPFIRTGDSHPRSIAKTVSWRVTGSVDTFVLGLIFTGNAKIAGSIAVAEMATKMVLYYLHERAWSAIRWNQ